MTVGNLRIYMHDRRKPADKQAAPEQPDTLQHIHPVSQAAHGAQHPGLDPAAALQLIPAAELTSCSTGSVWDT